MRVIVTGGAGFIGSHLTDELFRRGHEVAVLDDLSSGSWENVAKETPFFQIDIRDEGAVRRAFQEFKPDAISHQAAQMSVSRSVREPGFDAEVNVTGLINVCTAAVKVGVKRMTFASSGGVLYGETTQPAVEETPANPISPYGISKWAGEQYLKFFQREHGLNTIALRYANVYGERQNPHGEAGVVAIFCTRLLTGQTASINGDGKYIRDYVHVSDVVQANALALESTIDRFEAINVGTSIGTDVNILGARIRGLCQDLLHRAGKPATIPEFLYGPARAGDLRSNLVACDKARAVLGWEPRVELEQGLSRTASWFDQHLRK